MSGMTGKHEPTAGFRTRLERQIVSFMDDVEVPAPRPRRPAPAQRSWHRLRTAALVVIALGIGALGAVASAQVQESQQREQLLEAAQADLQLATMRLELARENHAAVRSRFDVGAVSREVLAAAGAEVARMEAGVRRQQLNVEEIRASSAPPRDDVAAPLVGERDFVRERLELDLTTAQVRFTVAEQALAETQRHHRLGLAPRLLLLEAQAEQARVQADMTLLLGTIRLRRRFLEADLTPGELSRQVQRLELEQAVRVAEQLRTLADERFSEVREQRSLGLADDLDVLRAELQAREQALELQRIMQQLQLLLQRN